MNAQFKPFRPSILIIDRSQDVIESIAKKFVAKAKKVSREEIAAASSWEEAIKRYKWHFKIVIADSGTSYRKMAKSFIDCGKRRFRKEINGHLPIGITSDIAEYLPDEDKFLCDLELPVEKIIWADVAFNFQMQNGS